MSESKRCIKCLSLQPVENFPWQRQHRARINMCRECRNKYQREWLAKRKAERDGKTLGQTVLSINRAKSSSTIEAILQDTVAEFGGWAGFVTAWTRYIKDLRKQPRRKSKKLADFFTCVIRMMEAPQPPTPVLEDDELADLIMDQVRQLIVDHPEIVAIAAEAVCVDDKSAPDTVL